MNKAEDLLKEIKDSADNMTAEPSDDGVKIVGLGKTVEKIVEKTEHKATEDSKKVSESITSLAGSMDKQSNILEKTFKEIKDGLKALTEAMSKKPEAVKTIVQNPTKFPPSMKISNLKDFPVQKEVRVKEIGELMAQVGKWSRKFRIGESLENVYKAIIKGPLNVKVDDKRPVEVQLVHKRDGKYKASGGGGAVSGGGAVFRNANGDVTSVQLDSPGHVPTDVLNKLVPEHFDYLDLTMTGSNLTKVEYYTGGAGGTVVATLDIAYDVGDNIDTVTKT